jgi:predicted DNA-binding protein
MPSKTPPTEKVVKWGKTGAPGSQKRRDFLDSIRKKKRKPRSKMVKEKIEDDIELVEEAPITLEEDTQEVEKPEPAVIKQKIKEPGPVVEKDYVDYPY